MARKHLDPEEEKRLIEEAEASRDRDQHPGSGRPVNRGEEPTVVMSVRIPLPQYSLIRAEATRLGVSVSQVVKDAIAILAAASGSRHWSSDTKFTFFDAHKPASTESRGTELDILPSDETAFSGRLSVTGPAGFVR